MKSTLAPGDPASEQSRTIGAVPVEALPDLADLYRAEMDRAQRHAQSLPVAKSWAERRRGSIAIGLLAPLVVLAAVSPPLAAAGSWAGLCLQLLASLLFLAGGACRFWAVLYIGGSKGRVVVSQGPYSLVRNPLYCGTLLMTLALVMFLENLTSIIGCMVVAAIYLGGTIPSEERRLASKLGEAYSEYCRRVPRLWPRLAGFRTDQQIRVDVHCLAAEARRALAWMWIPIAAQLLIHLRLQSWWPQLHWLP